MSEQPPYGQPYQLPPPGSAPIGGPAPQAKPWYKKKRFIIPLGLFALFVIIGIAAPPPEDEDTVASAPAVTQAPVPTTAAPVPTAAPTTAAPPVVVPPPAPATTAPPVATQAPAPDPAPPGKPADGDLVLESYTTDNAFGVCTGSLRLTNTSDSSESGGVKLTLLKGGVEITSLNGFFNEAEAGDTFSVDVFGTEACPGKPDEVDFSRAF